MTTYKPFGRLQRFGIAFVSASLSLTIVASLLLLFNEGRIPGAAPEVVAKTSSVR